MNKLVKITDNDSSVLRQKTKEISVEEINSSYISKVKEEMSSILNTEKFGVAIAAPQIGYNLSIFLISGETIAFAKKEEFNKDKHKDMFFFNPKLIKTSKKQILSDEGCLSVPYKYSYNVPRYEKITISYLSENGEQMIYNATGFLAKVIQHEYDHLNGILYTDKAKEVINVDKDLKPINNNDKQ